ncbi:MAG: hypothetical protein K0R44_24 [Thermomicrobiales bacterium]|jgi:hypothetical protein|nr:hypothetical protein [Thermomicrobiales bacterium]MDF3014799.1 hypothetical protein [Thermomicrobiales bacterium]
MTEEEALKVLTPLAVAFPFGDDQVELWVEKLRSLSNAFIAMKTTNSLIDEHEGLRAPAWAVFKKQYDRFHARWEEEESERRLALEAPQGRLAGMISPKEGRQIAAAAYAKQYKRKPPANIFDLPDPEFVPRATSEEVETALQVIRGGYDHDGMTFSKYTDVLKAFDGHQLTARAAVKTLEDSRQLVHRPDGTLILLRVRTIAGDERS